MHERVYAVKVERNELTVVFDNGLSLSIRGCGIECDTYFSAPGEVEYDLDELTRYLNSAVGRYVINVGQCVPLHLNGVQAEGLVIELNGGESSGRLTNLEVWLIVESREYYSGYIEYVYGIDEERYANALSDYITPLSGNDTSFVECNDTSFVECNDTPSVFSGY
jgi:hypothetical protein